MDLQYNSKAERKENSLKAGRKQINAESKIKIKGRKERLKLKAEVT